MCESGYDAARSLTEQWGQAHLLRFYDGLDAIQKEALLQDILSVDFPLVMGLYRRAAEPAAHADPACAIGPMPAIDKGGLPREELDRAFAVGMESVRGGQYAVATLAGGQGTRLGHSGPKGTLMITLDRPRSLFEIQLQEIRRLSQAGGAPVPWYIMTSGENHEATVEFFAQNDYFGYRHISFFRQGSLPMVGLDGRLLLESRHSIRKGPDGNGSIFRSLLRSGAAEDMARRGVRWFFACNVDNILARCGDPLPIGIAALRGVPCVSKSIMKRSPGEKVGVFCRVDGRPSVIEYTEITPELADQRDGGGQYVYGDAHISCTLFSTAVLERVRGEDLPYHTAIKKAPFIDETGEPVMPQTENAYKFESFIFDVFPRCGDIAVLRVDRNEEFAPIKNAAGEDSMESARELYLNAQRKR